MKKPINIVVLLTTLFLASCSHAEQPSGTKNSHMQEPLPFKYKIGFSRDEWSFTKEQVMNGTADVRGGLTSTIFDPETGKEYAFSDNQTNVFYLKLLETYLTTASDEKYIYIYDKDYKLVSQFETAGSPVGIVPSQFDRKIYTKEVVDGGDSTKDYSQMVEITFDDKLSPKSRLICKTDAPFAIISSHLSPNEKKLVIDQWSMFTHSGSMVLFDIATGNSAVLSDYVTCIGWLDDDHILVTTNRNSDGTRINTEYGVYASMNVNTKELKVIKAVGESRLFETLSPDKRFIAYTKIIPRKGKAIFVMEFETGKEYQITTPFIGKGNRYTEDVGPVWIDDSE